ncbi:MAG: hypothetical protein IKS07_00525 [Lachnospiraceae bacterium]|nr:hypothetical protein [Lachnospiraceae bacterium]
MNTTAAGPSASKPHTASAGNALRRALPLCLLYALILPVWIYLACQKDLWFCDEVYSYESANSGIFYYLNPLDEAGKHLTGQEITDYLSKGEKAFNFIEIEKYLYPDHVPLYFLLLRVCSLLAYGSASKWIGLSLNLVCYLLTAFLLYVFFRRFVKNAWGAALLSAAVCLHPILLSEATIIRMYGMLTAEMLLFAMAAGPDFFDPETNTNTGPGPADKEISAKQGPFQPTLLRCFLLSCAAAAGMLTHYYFWIFVFCCSLVQGLDLLISKRFRTLGLYIGSMVCALLFTTAGFPLVWKRTLLSGTNGEKAQGALAALKTPALLPGRIRDAFAAFGSELFRTGPDAQPGFLAPAVGIVLCLLAGAVLFIIRKLIDKTAVRDLALLSVAALLDLFLIAWASQDLAVRYLWGPMILMAVCALAALGTLLRVFSDALALKGLGKAGTLPVLFAVLLCAVHLAISLQPERIDWLRTRTPAEQSVIETVAAGKPWVIFSEDVDWRLHCSFYDFRLAGDLVRISSAQEESPAGDPALAAASGIVFYCFADSKDPGDCIRYLEAASGKKTAKCEQISHSAFMNVYLVTF